MVDRNSLLQGLIEKLQNKNPKEFSRSEENDEETQRDESTSRIESTSYYFWSRYSTSLDNLMIILEELSTQHSYHDGSPIDNSKKRYFLKVSREGVTIEDFEGEKIEMLYNNIKARVQAHATSDLYNALGS